MVEQQLVSSIKEGLEYVLAGCLNRFKFKFFIHSRLDSCLIFGISWTEFSDILRPTQRLEKAF